MPSIFDTILGLSPSKLHSELSYTFLQLEMTGGSLGDGQHPNRRTTYILITVTQCAVCISSLRAR